MNILIANTQEFNPSIGGVEKISNDLAKCLLDLKHNVYFVACLRSPYSQEYTPVAPQLILPSIQYLNAENIKVFSKYVLEKNIEILLNQAGNILEFTELCSMITKETKIPLISAIHTNPLNTLIALKDFKFSKMNNNKIKPFIRMLLYPFRYYRILKTEKVKYIKIAKISDKIVLLSNKFLEELQFFIGEKYDTKITFIPNFTSKCKYNNEITKEKNILFVGRLVSDHKRPDRILLIWEKIFKFYPNWHLKIAGDGPLKNDLINYVLKNEIKNVEFLGFCNIDQEYEKAEILCMTSTIEGLPMVLIEGSVFGCIPVAFNSFRSVYDIIDNKENGYIIKAYSKKEYIKVLKELIENEKFRSNVRKETLKIKEKFNKKNIIDKWISLFEEVKK